MNKTIIGFLVLSLLSVGLAAGLLITHRQNAELTRRLSTLENGLLTQSKTVADQNALLESAAAALAEVVATTKQKENASNQPAYETPVSSIPTKQAEEAVKAEIFPPTMSGDGGKKTFLFPSLINTKKEVLLTNAEFRTLAGRRVTFRVAGGVRAFDVDELHLGILAYLDIDPGAVKQNHELQKQRAMNAQMADAAARAQAARQWQEYAAKLQVEQEKAAVFRAERLKIAEEAENERRKVRAAQAQAVAQTMAAQAQERAAQAAERQARAQEEASWELRNQRLSRGIESLTPTRVQIVP
jgi:hypothetical protein